MNQVAIAVSLETMVDIISPEGDATCETLSQIDTGSSLVSVCRHSLYGNISIVNDAVKDIAVIIADEDAAARIQQVSI